MGRIIVFTCHCPSKRNLVNTFFRGIAFFAVAGIMASCVPFKFSAVSLSTDVIMYEYFVIILGMTEDRHQIFQNLYIYL